MRAELDTSAYDTGVKISDRQMGALPLTRHAWHGDWNYAPRPEAYDQISDAPDLFDRPSPDLAWLCHRSPSPPCSASGPKPSKRIRNIRQLLEQAGHAIQPGPHRLASLDDLTSFASAQGITAPPEIKTAC